MVKRLRHRPFTAVTRVRFPLESLYLAPWPSGKAKVCNTSITSSNLVGASLKTVDDYPLSFLFIFLYVFSMIKI